MTGPRPSPLWVPVYEMPFWAILSVLALVPGHLYPWSAVAGVPIKIGRAHV